MGYILINIAFIVMQSVCTHFFGHSLFASPGNLITKLVGYYVCVCACVKLSHDISQSLPNWLSLWIYLLMNSFTSQAIILG